MLLMKCSFMHNFSHARSLVSQLNSCVNSTKKVLCPSHQNLKMNPLRLTLQIRELVNIGFYHHTIVGARSPKAGFCQCWLTLPFPKESLVLALTLNKFLRSSSVGLSQVFQNFKPWDIDYGVIFFTFENLWAQFINYI